MKSLLSQTRVWSWLLIGIGAVLVGACDNSSTLVIKEDSTFEYESAHDLGPILESSLSPFSSDAGADLDDTLLRVGFAPARKPYTGLDERGRPVGFDIEFTSMLLDHLERDYAFIPVPADEGWRQLEAERLDLLIGVSGSSWLPEAIHVTESYGAYKRDTVTARVKRGPHHENIAPIDAWMPILSRGRPVSTTRFGMYRQEALGPEPLSTKIGQRTCLEQLLAGTIELCSLERRFAAHLADSRDLPLQSVGGRLARRPRAVAVGPSVRDAFVHQLNRTLETLRGTRAMETLRRQWFESRALGTL